MPTATEILRHEHEAILRVLDALDEAGRRLVDGRPVPVATLEGLLEFLGTFADRCHHAKEEGVLFPALEARGMPREMGPVGVMLAEHEAGRACVRRMREAVPVVARGRVDAGERFVAAGADYTGLLRDHIAKENEVLFPMAEELLGPAALEALAEDFERVEAAVGAGVHERMHGLMDRLLRELRPAALR